MHINTPIILDGIRKTTTLKDRTAVLHNCYHDEVAFVFSCGPSLTKVFNDNVAHYLRNRLVVSVKSAYNLVGSMTDLYLMNPVRVPVLTEPFSTHTIKVCSSHLWHDNMLDMLCQGCDVFYPIAGCPLDQSMVAQGTEHAFDRAAFPKPGCVVPPRPWGPGVLLDVGLFLLVHMGVRRIIVVGWDMGDKVYTHYDNAHNMFNEEGIALETEMAKKATRALVQWMKNRGVALQLCSPLSVLPIPQIPVEELIRA